MSIHASSRRVFGLRNLLAAASLLACVASAWSLTIREMRALEKSDPKQGPFYVQYYLIGAMEAAIEMQAQTARGGSKPMFCLNGRKPEPRRAKPMVDAELKRNADVYEADMPLELVVVNALVSTYPC